MNTFHEASPAPDGRPPKIIELPWGDIDLNARPEQDSRIEAEIANKFGSLIGGLHSRYAEHVLREEKFVPESATTSSVTGRMHTGYYLSLQLPTNSYDPEGSYWSVRVSSLGAGHRLSMWRVEDYRSHEDIESFMDAGNTVRRHA